ncbi:MAG: archaetidylserine decarboxylase [Pseudomonadota bacterium]
MNLKHYLFALPQYLLPHHPLSRLMGLLTHSKNRLWKTFFIRQVVKLYRVNLEETANPDIEAYASFNDFFTRALNPDARPIAAEANAVAGPADGAVSQAGDIVDGNIIQAKGKHFPVTALLGGDEARAEPFKGGKFATIYLSPRDYHRLHMPLTGTLKEMVHIPGRLFSVNRATADVVPGLFARNERVAAIFDTDAGPMALVLVGAIFVASIETVWEGIVTPPSSPAVRVWNYPDNAPRLQRGDEMGRFNMGSTIIVLFGKDRVNWSESLTAEATVRMGETIGMVID